MYTHFYLQCQVFHLFTMEVNGSLKEFILVFKIHRLLLEMDILKISNAVDFVVLAFIKPVLAIREQNGNHMLHQGHISQSILLDINNIQILLLWKGK